MCHDAVLVSINDVQEWISYNEFYNDAVESIIELKEEYPRWKSREGFSFCNYPYILSTSTKGDILKIESMIQMRHELQDAFFRAMFIGVNSPYLQRMPFLFKEAFPINDFGSFVRPPRSEAVDIAW